MPENFYGTSNSEHGPISILNLSSSNLRIRRNSTKPLSKKKSSNVIKNKKTSTDRTLQFYTVS